MKRTRTWTPAPLSRSLTPWLHGSRNGDNSTIRLVIDTTPTDAFGDDAGLPASLPAKQPVTVSAEAGTPAQVPASVAYPKTIKSFVTRAGRTTAGQARAFEEQGPQYLLPYQTNTIDFVATYSYGTRARGINDGENRPVVLEIGFGMGEATAHIAAAMPDTHFLCCEVHEAGVGALLKRMGEQGLSNIRIIQHDAVEVIDNMLPPWRAADTQPTGLDGVHIFFPDPWHKKRHNKRRLIQVPFIAKLATRLKPGGYIHCATDWQPYAEQILEVLSAEPLLINTVDGDPQDGRGYAPKPHYRPLTKFENRGIKLGHGVWDMVFTRR